MTRPPRDPVVTPALQLGTEVETVRADDLLGLLGSSDVPEPRRHAAFETLYRQYHRLVLAALSSLVPGHIADELAQDFWLDLWKKPSGYEAGHFTAWLYRAACNRALSYLRKRSNHQSALPIGYDLPMLEAHREDPALDYLAECIELLPERLRNVIRGLLADVDTDGIARLVGANTPAAVYRLGTEARKNLRDCVEGKLK